MQHIHSLIHGLRHLHASPFLTREQPETAAVGASHTPSTHSLSVVCSHKDIHTYMLLTYLTVCPALLVGCNALCLTAFDLLASFRGRQSSATTSTAAAGVWLAAAQHVCCPGCMRTCCVIPTATEAACILLCCTQEEAAALAAQCPLAPLPASLIIIPMGGGRNGGWCCTTPPAQALQGVAVHLIDSPRLVGCRAGGLGWVLGTVVWGSGCGEVRVFLWVKVVLCALPASTHCVCFGGGEKKR